MKQSIEQIILKNKKAYFEYEVLDEYISGIVLSGCEIKSIRARDVSLSDAWCAFDERGELYIKNMHISPYDHRGFAKVEPKRDRKLLLTKRELHKLQDKVKTKGLTIAPLGLFIASNGLCKLKIALVKGKHTYDKSKSIKERDLSRSMQRDIKQ